MRFTGLANETAGTAQTLTVEAEDQYGNEVTTYTGTVHFTSTDAQAVLPANYTFTNVDAGQHVFTNGVTLKTAGSQTVTATDTINPPLVTGTSTAVTISAAALSTFVLTGLGNQTAGTAQTLTVEAEDQYGNEVTTYTGTVHFTSSDAQAGLPSDYTFTNGDGGEHVFTNGITLKTAGSQTVTATDTVNPPLVTGTSTAVTISAAALSTFVLTGLGNQTAGTAQSLTVEAEDQYGNEVTTYTGTVHFTSSDAQAVLPANYTFTNGDAGQHVFTSGVTLKTAGSQTVTATDTVNPPLVTGTSTAVTISAAALSTFVLTGLGNETAGTAQTLTVEAEDQYGNEITTYTGTVHFTSSDAQAVLPANYTFTNVDAGQHVFTNGVTLKTAGSQTVTATDTVNPPLVTGTSTAVTISAAAATHFVFTGPTAATAGTPQSVTVEAEDQYGNEVTNYTGTVHFTSTDPKASLPADYTFTNDDGGQHTFTNGVTLETAGPQTVSATDTGNPSLTNTSPIATIVPAAVSQFVLTGLASATAGTQQSLNVEAEDPYGNEVTTYFGTVHFTSSDTQAGLPANYTFTNVDAGQHTFTNGVTFKTASSQTVTATDTVTLSLTGTSPSVTVSPAAAATFIVTSDGAPGSQVTVTVTAFDAYGNVATGYNGTVVFGSSDAGAILPSTNTMADGLGTFVYTFDTTGTYTVTVTDATDLGLTGGTTVTVTQQTTQAGSVVSSAPQTFYGESVTLTGHLQRHRRRQLPHDWHGRLLRWINLPRHRDRRSDHGECRRADVDASRRPRPRRQQPGRLDNDP